MKLLPSYCATTRLTLCLCVLFHHTAIKAQEKTVGLESCYMKAADILKEFLKQYADRGEANKVGNVFTHSKESVNKSILSTSSSRANAVHVYHCCCFTCPTGFDWYFKKGMLLFLCGCEKAELMRLRCSIGQKYAFRIISLRLENTQHWTHVGCPWVNC